MDANIPFKRISCEEARKLIAHGDTNVFDVRDDVSFSRGHIDGAVKVSLRNISDVVETTQKSQAVVIYCHRGEASREYAKFFCDYGFLDVYSLEGGYDAWRRLPPSIEVGPVDDHLAKWLSEHLFAGGVNSTGANDATPLMLASNEGENAIVGKLIAAGASLNARNRDGNNALWLACAGDRLDTLDLLVSAGVDINSRNDNGATALMYAASAGKHAVVDRLLSLGADPSPETLDGFSALDLASTLECLTLLRRKTRFVGTSTTPVHRSVATIQPAGQTET